MKKIALLFIMVASLALVSCGGRGAKKAAAEATQTEQAATVTDGENCSADTEGCTGECADKAQTCTCEGTEHAEGCTGECANKKAECCGDKAEGETVASTNAE